MQTIEVLKSESELPKKPTWALLAAVAAAAVFGNIALRVGYASVAMFISTVLLVLGLFFTRRTKSTTEYAMLVLAVLTASNYFLRNSALVIFLSVVTTGSLMAAVTYRPFGQRVIDWFESAYSAAHDELRAPGWFAKLMPSRSSESEIRIATVLRGVALALATALPVVILLASGDAVFASFFNGLNVSIPGSAVSHTIVSALLFVIALGPMLSASLANRQIDEAPQSKRSLGDFKIALSALVVVMLVWCFSQVLVALGGAESIFETEGLTRAEYARQGFFQLVAVAAIVIAAVRYTAWRLGNKQEADASAGLVRVLALVLTVATLVLVAVSYSRLFLYIEAFDLTVTRLFVAWFLAWLGLNLLFAVYRLFVQPAESSSTTAFSFGLIAAGVLVCLFGWSNPEAFVAETNIDRFNEAATSENRELDVNYLVRLSADAVPSLVEITDQVKGLDPWLIRYACDESEERYGFAGFNKAVSDANEARAQLCN